MQKMKMTYIMTKIIPIDSSIHEEINFELGWYATSDNNNFWGKI